MIAVHSPIDDAADVAGRAGLEPASRPVLAATGLVKRFGQTEALRGVTFSVPKGCTYGVIGRNGSGKSTLLKCVAGITKPNEGSIRVLEKNGFREEGYAVGYLCINGVWEDHRIFARTRD